MQTVIDKFTSVTTWQSTFVAVALVLAYFALRTAYRAVSRAYRKFAENRPAEDTLTIVAASIATGVSAQGMWRFSGDVLGFDGPLRLLLFAFIEVAVITSAVRARRNMRENYSAGIDGMAVWVLTGLSAVLSGLDARSLAEAIFRLAAPVVAAWLWERGMAIERQRLAGRSRVKWRFTLDRAMVRLGLAEVADRTVSEVDAYRRLTRVALAAKRVLQLRQASASDRKVRAAVAARDRRLDQAVEHTDLATNPATRARLLDITSAMGSAEDLTQVLANAPAPWADDDHPALLRQPRASEAVMLAAALDRNTAARLGGLPEAGVTGDRSATTLASGRPTDGEQPSAGAELPPPAREVRSWRARLAGRTRPDVVVAAAHRSAGAGTRAGAEADASVKRPAPTPDRPTEQDRLRVAGWWAKRVRAGEVLGKYQLAERTGFKSTWCSHRIAEGRRLLTAEGWTFGDDGVPIPPSRPDAGLDASATHLAATGGGA
ncbi:hypothetical protein [Sphaerisporangium sp. NPDC051011]|uniref:hypothetical protein n=1 Tax=Sphaerisporangium sp. NPDC051011 TaxID=3155792 RepID=UPI00340B247E